MLYIDPKLVKNHRLTFPVFVEIFRRQKFNKYCVSKLLVPNFNILSLFWKFKFGQKILNAK